MVRSRIDANKVTVMAIDVLSLQDRSTDLESRIAAKYIYIYIPTLLPIEFIKLFAICDRDST